MSGQKVSRSQGSSSQGLKVSKSQSLKASRSQGLMVSWSQGLNVSRGLGDGGVGGDKVDRDEGDCNL